MGALFSYLWQQGIWYDSEGRDLPFEGKYFQQERFKSILPCILIIWIHKAFKDGTLKKINGKTLHTTLKLPISWIRDSLEILKEKNYIFISNNNKDNNYKHFY